MTSAETGQVAPIAALLKFKKVSGTVSGHCFVSVLTNEKSRQLVTFSFQCHFSTVEIPVVIKIELSVPRARTTFSLRDLPVSMWFTLSLQKICVKCSFRKGSPKRYHQFWFGIWIAVEKVESHCPKPQLFFISIVAMFFTVAPIFRSENRRFNKMNHNKKV